MLKQHHIQSAENMKLFCFSDLLIEPKITSNFYLIPQCNPVDTQPITVSHTQSWGEPKFIPLAAVHNAEVLTFVVEMEILNVTFYKTKSRGDIRQIVDPLHIQQIIEST